MPPDPLVTFTKAHDTSACGGLIHADALAAFDDLVGGAVAKLSPQYEEFSIETLRPPLATIPDLLDTAAEVLAGNPAAATRFRELLTSLGGAAVPTGVAMRILQTHADGKCSCGQSERMPDSRHHDPSTQAGAKGAGMSIDSNRVIDMQRLEPVMAAAVYAARDAAELAVLVGGIRLGLAGADEMNTLFGLVASGADRCAIEGALGTAIRVMGLPDAPGLAGFTSGGDMAGFPVPRFGGRTGAPWFAWPPRAPGEWGPPPPPTPGIPTLDGSLIDHFEQCMIFEVIPEMHRLGIGFPELIHGTASYVIETIAPENACPGDLLTITGRHFEGVTAMQFVDGRGQRVSAPPETSSHTQVTVRLPPTAVSGPVWLHIPVTTQLCLQEMHLARPGTAGRIRVGRPAVADFRIEGGRTCVTSGAPAALRWSASPSDAQVRIVQVMDGPDTVLQDNLPASGRLDLDTSATGERFYRLEVINPGAAASCALATAMARLEVRTPTPLIEIVGVEVTQAIQVFDLANPTAATNNSVPLIAGMDTVLRAFVRRTTPDAVRITGSLALNGVIYRPINHTAAYGAGPFIDAPDAPNRAETNHSLNFLIPAADASGADLVAEISIFTSGYYCGDVEEHWTQTLTWVDRPALPVTVRRIAESDGRVVTEAEARELIRRAFRKMPSPRTAISLHPGVFQINTGTTEDNYCHDGAYYLLAVAVAYEHNDTEGYAPDPHESSWIGLYSQSNCTTAFGDINGMMAWPWTSTCVAEPNATVAAHELMHTVGLGHTVTGIEPCEDAFQPVACHRFPHMPDGELVEVPFDIDNNTTVSPAFDLQSYRGGDARWLCPELWIEGRRLMNDRY